MSIDASIFTPMIRFRLARRRTTKTKSRITAWITLPLTLWAMLWLSINTGPWNLYDFGNGLSSSITAIRASFPLIVYSVAFFSLASYRPRCRSWAEKGFWIYALIMLLACTGANNWFDQAYWGFAFLATLAVAEKGLRSRRPFQFATQLNWLSWLVTTAALVTMLVLARSVLYAPRTDTAYGLIDRFQQAHGYLISRETGLSRMAAVPAIISLVYLFAGKPWQRVLSLAIFLASAYIIWIMQSRGALFSFIGAFLFVLFFGQRRDRQLAIILSAVLCLIAFVGFTAQGELHDVWLHATRSQGVAGFSTMSGRNFIWQEALRHWRQSPLFGYGPQADRLFFFNAQNALVYALLCAGAVGATFFLIAFVSAWRALFSLILNSGRLTSEERKMLQITGAILVFSTLRSYPENNAALFSVDLLLQYPAMIYLTVLAARLRKSWIGVRQQQHSPIGLALAAGSAAPKGRNIVSLFRGYAPNV